MDSDNADSRQRLRSKPTEPSGSARFHNSQACSGGTANVGGMVSSGLAP